MTATATFPWVAWVITVGIVTIQGHSGFRRRRRLLSTTPDPAEAAEASRGCLAGLPVPVTRSKQPGC